MSLVNERSVFANLNARSELELLDNIYDRIIITDNSANILNILAESSAINPDEDIIRKRGRRKTPKLSQLPLRRSPRKAPSSIGYQRSAAAASVSMDLSTDETASTTTQASHDYFLRTPKKTPTKSLFSRTPRKTPSKSGSAAVNTPSKQRVSPRKRLQLDGDDSGIGLTPTYLSPDYLQDTTTTPSTSGYKSKSSAASANTTTVQKSKSGSKSASVISRRRRRRYF